MCTVANVVEREFLKRRDHLKRIYLFFCDKRRVTYFDIIDFGIQNPVNFNEPQFLSGYRINIIGYFKYTTTYPTSIRNIFFFLIQNRMKVKPKGKTNTHTHSDFNGFLPRYFFFQIRRHTERVVADQHCAHRGSDRDHGHRGRVRRVRVLRDARYPKVYG